MLDTESAPSPLGSALLFTVEAAARALGISRTHVYNALQRGSLRSVAIGRSRRIPREEIERVAREGLQ